MTAIWGVLEIDPTRDEELIKKAYHKKLAHTHPEDDPEGFKRLRASYEEALKWAKAQEEILDEIPKSPIDLWMEQVKDVYSHFSKRIDISSWHKLFENELCQGLDTSEMALNHLLNFLSEHFYLPQGVWQLMDQVFCIQELKKSLIEKFSENFISYIENQIKNKGFIEWELLKGEDTADYDTYIEKYLTLVRYLDDFNDQENAAFSEKQKVQYETLVKKIEDLNISYPHFTVQKLRYALMQNDKEKAYSIALQLEASPYSKDNYVSYFIGKAKWVNHEEEAAYNIWQALLERKPEHYGAKVGMIYYGIYKHEYKTAKEQVLDIMEHYGETQETNKLMNQANNQLIIQMIQERKNRPKDEALRLELGWCYFQNKDYEACRKLFKGYIPSEPYCFEYHNLKGRNDFAGGYLEEALPELITWLKNIKALIDDGSEEYKTRHRRIGYANFLVGMCHSALAEKAEDVSQDKHYKEAQKFLEEAIRVASPKNDYILSYKERLGNVLLKLGENEKCVDLCDEIIKVDKKFYLAYILRQEAFFALHNAQGVIDDYYEATSIYEGYIKPYLLAIEVFMIFNQYDEAQNVVTRARELKLKSLKLDFLSLKIKRQHSHTIEAYESIISSLKNLINTAKQTNDAEIDNLGEVYLELALSHMDLEEYKAALAEINLALDYNEENTYYKWIKADILQGLNLYAQALHLYETISSVYETNSEFYYDIGRCLYSLGRLDEALKAYKKTRELNHKHGDVNDQLRKIHLKKFRETGNKTNYELALRYSEKQIEIRPKAYYLINRGLTFLEDYDLEGALKDFEAALEDEPENAYAYNNLGYTYKILEDYEKAVEMYQQGLKINDSRCLLLLYSSLAACYMAIGTYEKAEECYQKCMESLPYEHSVYDDLIKVYHRMDKDKEAISLCKKLLRHTNVDKVNLYLDLGSTYANLGQYVRAAYYYRKAVHTAEGDGHIYDKMGDFYFEITHNYKKAVKAYEKALEMYEAKHYSSIYTCISLAQSYGELHQVKTAKIYFNKVLKMIEERYEYLDNYLDYKPLGPLRHYEIGCLYMAIGDIEIAKQYFDQISYLKKCRHCEYGQCYEAIEGQGRIYLLQGDLLNAKSCFERALAINPTSGISKYYLKKLQNKE